MKKDKNTDLDFYEQSDVLDSLIRYLKSSCREYAVIHHTQDTKEVDGDIVYKTPHIHFVGNLIKATRLSTVLNRIADSCIYDGGVINSQAVSIQKYTSFESCIRYLIHKDDSDKYQYGKEDIFSNIPADELDTILNSEYLVVDAEYLSKVIRESVNLEDVLFKLGLFYYHRYRPVIKDLWLVHHGKNVFDVPVSKYGEIKKRGDN